MHAHRFIAGCFSLAALAPLAALIGVAGCVSTSQSGPQIPEEAGARTSPDPESPAIGLERPDQGKDNPAPVGYADAGSSVDPDPEPGPTPPKSKCHDPATDDYVNLTGAPFVGDWGSISGGAFTCGAGSAELRVTGQRGLDIEATLTLQQWSTTTACRTGCSSTKSPDMTLVLQGKLVDDDPSRGCVLQASLGSGATLGGLDLTIDPQGSEAVGTAKAPCSAPAVAVRFKR